MMWLMYEHQKKTENWSDVGKELENPTGKIWAPLKVKIQIFIKVGFMVFKSCVLKPRFRQQKRKNNPTLWGRDIKQTVSKSNVLACYISFWHGLLNISVIFVLMNLFWGLN
jgi:hypothetical protein